MMILNRICQQPVFRLLFRKKFSNSTQPENDSTKRYFESVKKSIEKRFSYESRFKTGFAVAGIFLATSTAGWFIFRDKFRSVAVREASIITQKSLEDEELQRKVDSIAAASTKMILSDPFIYAQLIQLLKVVGNDEEIAQSTSLLLQKAIRMPEFKKMLISTLTEILSDKETKKVVENLTKRLLIDLLKDEDLKKQLVGYLQSVARDASLQQTVGESLWKSSKIAFLPRFLR